MTTRKILRTAEAAKYLGLAQQTIRLYRMHGTGPRYVRLGNGTRSPVGYYLSDLDKWLDARTFNSTAEEAVAAAK